MAHYQAAVFVKYSMPFAVSRDTPAGQVGLLSDQDAVDVSEFFTHQPRPDFSGRANDWPSEPKPKDARQHPWAALTHAAALPVTAGPRAVGARPRT